MHNAGMRSKKAIRTIILSHIGDIRSPHSEVDRAANLDAEIAIHGIHIARARDASNNSYPYGDDAPSTLYQAAAYDESNHNGS